MEIATSPHNFLIHGPGGTGKTYLLKNIAEFYDRSGVPYALVAPTGVAAYNLQDSARYITAKTIHAYCGIGLGKGNIYSLIKRIRRKQLAHRYTQLKVLIIDEISMVGAAFFEKLNTIFQTLRENRVELFGGVKLILSGDFLQIPPVHDEYLFKSSIFLKEEWKMHPMTVPYRYTDNDMFALLMRCRYGEITDADIDILTERWTAFGNLQSGLLDIKPTRLMTHIADVNRINTESMNKLSGEAVLFRSRDTVEKINEEHSETEDGYDPDADSIEDSDFLEQAKSHMEYQLPEIVILKVGAQVMFRVNLDVDRGIVNGTRGVVTELSASPPLIKVKLMDGKDVNVEPYKLKINNKRKCAVRKQIPIIPAFAITIHKSQGLTLDCAVIDLNNRTFCGGQGYVALSRVKNLQGLYLSAFDPSAIFANKEAHEYVKNLEKLITQ